MTLALAVAGAALGVAATMSPADAASSASTLPSASTVTPAATEPAALAGIACRTINDCMAVGSNTPSMATQLAAEQWNGKKWSRVAMPKPAGAANVDAADVACPTARECVAVGVGYPGNAGFYALAGYWNGTRWTTGKAAAPGASSELIAITCPSAASCYAVGEYTPKGSAANDALIEHWNGKSWTQQAAPEPRGTPFDQLYAVSCAKTSFCVAVGTDGSGLLIERWNGSAWTATTRSGSDIAALWGVSCPASTSCYATGGTGSSVILLRWNGKTWSSVAAPAPASSTSPLLQSVSCVSASRCLAVGNEFTPRVFADQWNGTTWKAVTVNTSGGHLGYFEQVQCFSVTSCIALGSVNSESAAWRSESAIWNGKSWKVVLTV